MIRESMLPSRRWLAASAAAVLVTASASAALAAGHTYTGKSVHVGKGQAHVAVTTDAEGQAVSMSVVLTPGALKGLPTGLNKHTAEGSWEFPMPVPAKAHTGFTEVVIDWNPHGHPPPHIYTVPHFDFHFYAISPKTVKAIKFSGPKDPAAVVADKGLVPPDYKVIAETAVNAMGVHAVDTAAPEFHGKPFTATFIYGYDKGRLIFLEPMVTLKFLESKPDFHAPVAVPAHYSSPGDYPTAYSVTYDAAHKRYMVTLGGLKAFK